MRTILLLIALLALGVLARCGQHQPRPATMVSMPARPVDRTTVPAPPIVESPLLLPTLAPGPDAALPPYIPEDQIPLCPESDAAYPPAAATAAPREMDNAAPPRCRARMLDLPVDPNYKGSVPGPMEINVSLAADGHTVHILTPCATLTPFTDYRDFMARGMTVSSAYGVLRGYGGRYVNPDAVLPPAEATLVFDNSAGCE